MLTDNAKVLDGRTDRRCLIGLTLIITLFLVILEKRYPYFFLQDDNRDQYLPYFVHNYRALLQGEIALFNFHQYLGLPHLANGNASALYPLSWLSVLVSRLFWGHDFAAIDLVVSFHLLLGSIGFFLMLRSFGLDQPGSLFGAVTWPLTSYFLYISNSWYVVSGPVAFMPWMIYAAISLHRGDQPWRSLTILVGARLLLVFIGHPQFFLYTLIFEFLLFMLLMPGKQTGSIESSGSKEPSGSKASSDKKEPAVSKAASCSRAHRGLSGLSRGRRLYLFSYVMTGIFSLPLILPMWQQTRQSTRSGPLDWQTFVSGSTVLPMWLKGLTDPYEGHVFQSISFVGLTCLAFCLVAAVFLILSLASRRIVAENQKKSLAVLFVLGLISFMWAGNILITKLIYLIPILNRFRWPYKLLIQFYLFLIAFSSYGLYLLFDKLRKIKWFHGREKILHYAVFCLIGIQLVQFGCLYYRHPVRGLRIHLEPVPWEEPLKDQLTGGRILSVGFDYTAPYTAHTLAFNYSTFWGLHHFAGYDALLPAENDRATPGAGAYSGYYDDLGNHEARLVDNIDAMQSWGVRWYVVNPAYIQRYGALPFTQVSTGSDRVIYFDSEAKPMAYWSSSEQKQGIELSHTANSLYVQTDHDYAENLVINALWNRYFQASLDGNPVPLVCHDDRFMIYIPEGRHTVKVTYQDPYFSAGCRIALSFLLLLILYGVARRRGWFTGSMSRNSRKNIRDGHSQEDGSDEGL